MGNAYSVSAFEYNKDDIGIDPDTEQKFVPTSKELELFKKEKMNLYKGTWTVCFVYGISAFILLAIVLFTDMGREYIYNKYLPAVLTYVVGAIIIIIYLVYSIFNIKPRKLGKVVKKQNNCLVGRMSGSGSTCFGIFEQEEDVKVAMNKLKEIFKNFWIHYEKIYI